MDWCGILIFLLIGVFLFIKFMHCLEIHWEKRVSFFKAIFFGFFMPFGSVFIANAGSRFTWECDFCGNDKNEVEFCGVCGRNATGEEKEKYEN